MDNIFPAFLFTARGMLSKRSADRIGMRTVTPDREREIELAHELMTIGFFFLCSLKILAQGGHQVTSRWKPFSEASAFADPEERLRWSCLPLPILAMTLCPNFRTVSSLAVGPGTFLQSCQWQLALVFLSFDVSNFHAYWDEAVFDQVWFQNALSAFMLGAPRLKHAEAEPLSLMFPPPWRPATSNLE